MQWELVNYYYIFKNIRLFCFKAYLWGIYIVIECYHCYYSICIATARTVMKGKQV